MGRKDQLGPDIQTQAEHLAEDVGVRETTTETGFVVGLGVACDTLLFPEINEEIAGIGGSFVQVALPGGIAGDHVDGIEAPELRPGFQAMRHDIDLTEPVGHLGPHPGIVDRLGGTLSGSGHAGPAQHPFNRGGAWQSDQALLSQACLHGLGSDVGQALGRSGLGFEFAAGSFDGLAAPLVEPSRAASRCSRTLAEALEVLGLIKAGSPLVDPSERPVELASHVGGRASTA